ncbi:MAG: hypothetical protein ACLPVY_09815 [Acidimicrobiia bacterium]
MNKQVVRVAWFRSRTTSGRRWAGYLALVLLIGLLGGVALGAVAGARRTQSSFPAFLRSTNPSELTVFGLPSNKHGTLLSGIAHLPHITHVESYAQFAVELIEPNAGPTQAAPRGVALGSIDGLGFDQDRLTVIAGHLADPTRADEIMMTANAARLLGLHLGSVVSVGIFTTDQTHLSAFGTAAVQPKHKARVTVVGIVMFNNTVGQNDVDASTDPYMIFTPAFTRPRTQCCNTELTSGLQVDRSARAAPTVETELERILSAKGVGLSVRVTSGIEAQAERAIKPQAIALGVFGVIVALAALLLAGQVIGRQLRLDTDDLDLLRTIGASRSMTTADGLVGVIGAVVIGSFVAVAVAVGLSPLAPFGPSRRVYPTKGIAFDWTVLGVGVATLIVVLSAAAFRLASRRPHGRSDRREPAVPDGSTVGHGAATVPGSVSAGTGEAVSPVSACIFCGGPTALVGYLWPEWLCRVFTDGTGVWDAERYSDATIVERMRREVDQTVDCVCKTCSDGWIQRLDDDVRPFLMSMIVGADRRLPPAHQQLLARWAAKTAVVIESTDDTAIRTPPEVCAHLRQLGVHPGTQVLVGKYDGVQQVLTHERDVITTTTGAETHHLCTSTFVIGKALIQVCADPKRDHPGELGDDATHRFISLLANDSRTVDWPPRVPIDDAGYDHLRRRPEPEPHNPSWSGT